MLLGILVSVDAFRELIFNKIITYKAMNIILVKDKQDDMENKKKMIRSQNSKGIQ
jgi:hypothetical protein